MIQVNFKDNILHDKRFLLLCIEAVNEKNGTQYRYPSRRQR